MKLKGNQVYLDVCDKIIMKILEIQRENNHLRNSKRSRYNSDVGILLDSASLGDSMEVDLNAVKSLCYSPTANTNETFQTESSEIPAQPILRLLPIKDEPLNIEATEIGPSNAEPHNSLEDDTEENLRKKYLKLQIKNLQIVNYKETLKVIKLERELGISRTEIPKL